MTGTPEIVEGWLWASIGGGNRVAMPRQKSVSYLANGG
jgi:hypothetical protein